MSENILSTEQVQKGIRTYISQKVRSDSLEVPMLPHVAQKVMGLISQPEISIDDLGKVINKDQQLTARLMKIANSPIYSGSVEVTSVKRAVITVGLRTLQELIFSIAMGEKVFRSKLFSGRMKQLWEHSLAVGYISKEIAKLKKLNASYAFLCGLLHDIGKPLLLLTLEEMSVKSKGRILFSDEMVDDMLFSYHQEVGGLVAMAWGFPVKLRGAIRNHHNYREAKESEKPALLVRAADLFAYAIGKGSYASYEEINPLAKAEITALGLTEDDVELLRETLPDTIDLLIDQFNN